MTVTYSAEEWAAITSHPLYAAADALSLRASERGRERYTVEAINAYTRASELVFWIAQDLRLELHEREAEAAEAAAAAKNGAGHGGSDADP